MLALSHIKLRVKDTVRRTALGGVGALFALVGIGFLTAAGYIALARALGTLDALLIVGGVFVGLGLVVIAIAGRRPRHRVPPTPQPTELASAFIQGMSQGARVARRR